MASTLADLTEYGEFVLNASVDEWGRRRTDGLLEDGTRIIVVGVGGQLFEISVDAVCQTSALLQTQATFNVAKDAAVAGQGLRVSEVAFGLLKDAGVTALAGALVEAVAGVIEIFVDAVAGAGALCMLESTFNVSPEAAVKVAAEVSVYKPAEVRVAKLFLVLGDLAIQIQGG